MSISRLIFIHFGRPMIKTFIFVGKIALWPVAHIPISWYFTAQILRFLSVYVGLPFGVFGLIGTAVQMDTHLAFGGAIIAGGSIATYIAAHFSVIGMERAANWIDRQNQRLTTWLSDVT